MPRRLVVDPGASARRMLRFGAVICGLLGLGGILGVLSGTGFGTFLIVGLFFLAFAGFFAFGSTRVRASDRLEFDERGIHGPDWSVTWARLRTARTATASARTATTGTRLQYPCLELTPSDVDEATALAELARFWDERDQLWRVPVSPTGNALRRAARGIRRFRQR